jgi:transcription initiation factor IIF auxiliary subunit
MKILQSEKFIGDNWWNWSVWLDGDPAELDQVEFVEWRLHPTFPNPIRHIKDRETNFKLDTGGWGVFPIQATVHFKDGKTAPLRHSLRLHYPDGVENTE